MTSPYEYFIQKGEFSHHTYHAYEASEANIRQKKHCEKKIRDEYVNQEEKKCEQNPGEYYDINISSLWSRAHTHADSHWPEAKYGKSL